MLLRNLFISEDLINNLFWLEAREEAKSSLIFVKLIRELKYSIAGQYQYCKNLICHAAAENEMLNAGNFRR